MHPAMLSAIATILFRLAGCFTHAAMPSPASVLDTARVFPPAPPSHHVLWAASIPADGASVVLPVDIPVAQWRAHVATRLDAPVSGLPLTKPRCRARAFTRRVATTDGSCCDTTCRQRAVVLGQRGNSGEQASVGAGTRSWTEWRCGDNGVWSMPLVHPSQGHPPVRAFAPLLLSRMQTARALGRALSILHVTYHVYRGRYEQLRPEFVAACGAPLSSDAFSGFGLLDAATHNDAVRSAFSRLVGQVVKQLAHDIAVDKVPCFDGAQLSEAMHKRGINMRLLPLLANELTYREALQLRVIRTEMVVRAVKGELRARLRCVQVVHIVVQPTTWCLVDSGCACAVASSAHRSPPPHKHAIERSASLRRVSSTCCLGVDPPVQSFGRSVCMSLSRCANHPSRHR